MEKQFVFRGLVLSLIVGAGVSGCSVVADKVIGESCSVALTASQCNGNTIEACADNNGGWYEVNGNNVCSFKSNPDACAQEVVQVYCSSGRPANKSMDSVFQNLLKSTSSNIDLQMKVNDLMNAINQDINAENKQETED
jgi:hypothetical protein